MRQEGDIINSRDNAVMGDHDGVHKFYVGQKHIVESTKKDAMTDVNLEVVRILYSQKVVYMGYPHDRSFKNCQLVNFSSDSHIRIIHVINEIIR